MKRTLLFFAILGAQYKIQKVKRKKVIAFTLIRFTLIFRSVLFFRSLVLNAFKINKTFFYEIKTRNREEKVKLASSKETRFTIHIHNYHITYSNNFRLFQFAISFFMHRRGYGDEILLDFYHRKTQKKHKKKNSLIVFFMRLRCTWMNSVLKCVEYSGFNNKFICCHNISEFHLKFT